MALTSLEILKEYFDKHHKRCESEFMYWEVHVFKVNKRAMNLFKFTEEMYKPSDIYYNI